MVREKAVIFRKLQRKCQVLVLKYSLEGKGTVLPFLLSSLSIVKECACVTKKSCV